MDNRYHLCVSREKKEYFSLPARWNPVYFGAPEDDMTPLPVEDMTVNALSRPEKTSALKDLISPEQKIAIIIDDCTRPTPAAAILSVLLPYLVENGHPRQKVTIVVAVGTHVPVSPEDLRAKVGEDVAADYRIVQHNARQEDLVPIHVPGEEMVVRINPEVAGADFKIGISSILPHPMAGYGGGPKIVMPGVANLDYIRTHHMKHTIDPRSMAGKTEDNPFQDACMRVARAAGLDFSINCVYNMQGEVTHVVAGGLGSAYAAAIQLCYEKLGVRFEEKVDITITSTYPHTHAHQFPKGLAAPDRITRETGAILLSVPTISRLPDGFVSSFTTIREKSRNNPEAFVREAMERGLPFLPDKPLEFNMAMKCVIIRPQIRTVLVSPLISREEARIMGFDYAPDLSAGIALLEKDYPEARVAIFPSGGLIVPIIN